MINNRPSHLTEISFYKSLPRLPILVDRDMFPDILKFDIFDLCGLKPITRQISELSPGGIEVQPTEEVVEYYCSNNIRFLMVSIVANCCIFKEDNGVIRGHPYSVSVIPSSKRGQLDYVDPRFAMSFDLEDMPTNNCIYLNYDPFCGKWGLFGDYSVLAGKDGINSCFSDMIGFVLGVYFLADNFHKEDILLSNMGDAPRSIQKKYRNFRIKRYFNSFTSLQPRRIWGVGSPIELFLMQGMVNRGLSPVPQYLIYKDGSAYASFHDIFLDDSFNNDQTLITEADFYFPDSHLAIFCDSAKHHRSQKAKQKDASITKSLNDLGFNTLRISGPMIVEDLDNALNIVTDKLNELQ